MLQKYWASTVIFIGIFSQCINSNTDNIYRQYMKIYYSILSIDSIL